MRFADDQAMVSSSNAGLQRIIDALNKTLNDYGMNIKKTKVMSGTSVKVNVFRKCDHRRLQMS